jgi:signal transduction histidine kinase
MSERQFDDLTRIAAQICGTPIALISLIDEDRQWFKSQVGLEASETPRSMAFCAHAILQEGVFEIEDSQGDPRFRKNPLVLGAPHVRFYAGAPLESPDGFKIGTLCVIDRAPKKLQPEQIQALQALSRQAVSQMELRVKVFELNRSQAELVLRRDQALDASKAKSSFLANMSHEIRTPLNAIIGLTDVMLESNPQEEIRTHLKTVERAGNNLLAIINDVLDLSKIEGGGLELEQEPFSPEALGLEIVELLSSTAREKGIALTLQVSQGALGHFVGDSQRLRQVLTNLAGNAIKFTEKGRVHLEIGAVQGGGICFSVVDTGIGIAAEAVDKLFSDFVQADASTTRRFGGTGLGLSISQKIVQKMGGLIRVESRLGEGSRFEFELPLVRGGSEKAAPADRDAPAKVPGRKSILVVDDNDDNLDLIALYLKGSPHRADLARSGVEALRLYGSHAYDLVFLDIQMPEMDGHQVIRAMLASDSGLGRTSPPIVALTAHALSEERKRCEKSGFVEQLVKPIRKGDFSAALARYF